MKIVIDIPNGLYANLKKIQNGSIACSRILKLAQNGTPLEKVIGDIKANIADVRNHYMSNGGVFKHSAYGLDDALEIIDKHISGAESEDKECT